MLDVEFGDDLVDWSEVLAKAESLPPHLKRVLVLGVKGFPPQKIADRLNLNLTSVKQYNAQLNAAFNLEGLSRTEQFNFYNTIVRYVVQHSMQYPRMAEVVAAYTSEPVTIETIRLPRGVFTDPRDATLALRFVVVIVLI